MFGTWNCGCKGVRPLKILININTVETKSTYMIQKHCELSFYDANIFPVTYLRTVFRRNWIFLPDHSLRSSYLLSTLKTTISSSKHQENSTKYLNLKVDSTSTYRGELNVLKLLFFTTPGSRDSQEVVRSESSEYYRLWHNVTRRQLAGNLVENLKVVLLWSLYFPLWVLC